MEMSASGNKWVGLKGISFSEILQLIHLEMWDLIIGIRLHGWNYLFPIISLFQDVMNSGIINMW